MSLNESTNPLNNEFWIDEEYGGNYKHQIKAAETLTAAYGAIGVAHLIERSISEMNLAEHTVHEYGGLKPVLLENILCAQHVLLKLVAKNMEELCEHQKGDKKPDIKANQE